MTHDELLAKIDGKIKTAEDSWPWLIVRAVAALHRQVSVEYFDKDVCSTCSPDIDLYRYYPCPTIILIEKELK